MCTLTWHDTPEGYRVFFNRDERRERAAEIPPAVRRSGATRFIAPLDGDAGGTWVAVNEHGLSLCLLNGAPENPAPDGAAPRSYASRGALPLGAIACRFPAAVGDTLATADLERFRPFLLVAFAPDGAGLWARWSGASLEIFPHRPVEQPLVSSAFCVEGVRESRRALFDELCAGAPAAGRTAAHLAFHASHRPERGPHSPCMHRADASTRSFSGITVEAARMRFHWVPHAPCGGLPTAPVAALARAGPPVPSRGR